MVIADVNNYIAVYKNGKVKCKGKFEWEDLEKKKVAMLHKNKSFLIIPKAIYAYFVNGIPPEEFLAQNKSFYDYCAGVKAKGGWGFVERKIKDGEYTNTKLQKINRYYISEYGVKIVKVHNDGREIQVEAGKWLQTLYISHKENLFSEYDINYDYYINKVRKEIESLEPRTNQLSLF
jgi:hypothetical protein